MATETSSDILCCDAEHEPSGTVYDELDENVRRALWLRAYDKAGRADADKALAIRDRFVQVCLMGQSTERPGAPADIAMSAQV